MYYIGIDIAKLKHTCAVVSSSGIIVKKSFDFDNSHFGFSSLKSIFDSLDSSNIKIGFESTGHYSANLSQFLKNNRLPFRELNPYLVKQFSSSLSSRKTKTDKIDAEVIARFLMTVDSKSNLSLSYHISSLKSLSRHIFRLTKYISKSKVELVNLLDIAFPEFFSIYLRAVLFKASVSITHHSKLFASYYFKKKLDGKHRTLALICVSRKLLRIIYHLLTNNVSFNDNLI